MVKFIFQGKYFYFSENNAFLSYTQDYYNQYSIYGGTLQNGVSVGLPLFREDKNISIGSLHWLVTNYIRLQFWYLIFYKSSTNYKVDMYIHLRHQFNKVINGLIQHVSPNQALSSDFLSRNVSSNNKLVKVILISS